MIGFPGYGERLAIAQFMEQVFAAFVGQRFGIERLGFQELAEFAATRQHPALSFPPGPTEFAASFRSDRIA